MKIPTYEELKERCMERIPEELDRREGSLIDTAVGPVCAELAAAYITLQSYYDLLFPDTSEGEYLDRIARQYGLFRKEAECAELKAVFRDKEGNPFDPPEGMRFSLGGVFYTNGKSVNGEGRVICETAGETGNRLGNLLPADYLTGFGSAEAAAILIPGKETETDDKLRARVLELLAYPAFGGNVSDYKEKVGSVPGVGAVRVTPVLIGGGTVGIEILGNDLLPAGEELTEKVRLLLTPSEDGDGLGLAPIGHTVLVFSPEAEEISVSGKLLCEGEAEQAVEKASAAVKGYLETLRESWENGDPVVRISGMIAAISRAEGILDVSSLTINGGNENIQCSGVPAAGTIAFTAESVSS